MMLTDRFLAQVICLGIIQKIQKVTQTEQRMSDISTWLLSGNNVTSHQLSNLR